MLTFDLIFSILCQLFCLLHYFLLLVLHLDLLFILRTIFTNMNAILLPQHVFLLTSHNFCPFDHLLLFVFIILVLFVTTHLFILVFLFIIDSAFQFLHVPFNLLLLFLLLLLLHLQLLGHYELFITIYWTYLFFMHRTISCLFFNQFFFH